jgi:NAD(P)-dependent dehydrogenase (short-subunit alcohol dehydrogenase family)
MALQGKVIAISGGASGIGLATAKLVANRGATVCIADVDQKTLSEAAEYFKSQDIPFSVTEVDVTSRSMVDDWIDGVVKQFGRLDGAANCAGIVGKKHGITKITEMEDEEWDRIIGINLTGTMYCLRAELRNIADFGSIVNIASVCFDIVYGILAEYLQRITRHGPSRALSVFMYLILISISLSSNS